jgi:putative DNA primase/helicase
MSKVTDRKRTERYARKYEKLGISMLALTSPEGDNAASGKSPLFKGGYLSAVKTARKLLKSVEGIKSYNLGIATGRVSGLMVIDIDPRHGGDETLKRLERELGELPTTWTVHTGGNGKHLYFSRPENLDIPRDSAGKLLGPGLDVMGEKSHVVAPPSIHKSGRSYEWKSKSRLDRPPAALPPAWINYLKEKLTNKKPEGHTVSFSTLPKITKPGRNDSLFRIACGWRAGGDSEDEMLVRLQTLNEERCSPMLTDRELATIARSAAKYSKGSQKVDLPEILAGSTLANHFARGEHLTYTNGTFYRFGGTHWAPISDDLLRNAVLTEIEGLNKRGNSKVALLMAEVLTILRAKRVAKTDLFCESSPPPRIINCLNGELELHDDGSVKLVKNRPASGQRHTLQVNYDPEATCPEFDAALKSIFAKGSRPDGLIRHWNELMGYIIQPTRPHPIIVFLLGEGANGKSKLAETIIHLLGQDAVYSGRIEEIESSRFSIGALRGKLLFLDDDVRTRIRLPDGILKRLSEAKLMTGELKYKDASTFEARAQLMLLCNNVSFLQDISYGMRRRLCVIPFDVSFKGDKMDEKLFDRIWANELPGVLNRALEGWKRLAERGRFRFPRDVVAATDNWVNEANPLSTFVDEVIQTDPNGRVSMKKVYEVFQEWSKASGIQRTLNRQMLTRDFKHRGFTIKKSNSDVVVYGIMLKK